MDYMRLDVDELLRLSISAIAAGKQADALVLLKALVERDPLNVDGVYLLAAQHAELGLLDRAERGFRETLQRSPDYAIARLQFGQMLMSLERYDEARIVLESLLERDDDVGSYARSFVVATGDDLIGCLRELEHGLGLTQSIPALSVDMRRLRDKLAASAAQSNADRESRPETPAPMFLTGYGRAN